jgi:RNA polymerase sigma factor (sigma-70 family)
MGSIFCSYPWMVNSDEHDYIERVKGGDSTAYAFIIDKYKNMAYTIAYKISGNVEDAEDVAQESFIKAYQQIRQFEGKSKFSTWLYTIVYRTAISKLKENRIETISISNSINENYSLDFKMPQLEQLQLEDEQRYVKYAIQKLPKTEGLLISLYYMSENTIKEIHEITGMSLPNIKINLFRARKRLERELRFLIQHEFDSISKDGK